MQKTGMVDGYIRPIYKLMSPFAGPAVTVSLELCNPTTPNASPRDSPFVAKMKQATALASGRVDIELIPVLTTGFTDSCWVRPLGTQAYGFAPLDPDLDTNRAGVHGVDEAFAIDNLVLRTKMQVALAYLTLGDQQS